MLDAYVYADCLLIVPRVQYITAYSPRLNYSPSTAMGHGQNFAVAHVQTILIAC